MVSVVASWFLYIFTTHSYSYTTYSFPNSNVLLKSFLLTEAFWDCLFQHSSHMNQRLPSAPWYWLCSAGFHRSKQKSPVELHGSRIRSEDVYLSMQESQLLLKWRKEKSQEKISKKFTSPLYFRLRTLKRVLTCRKRAQHGNAWLRRDPPKCEVPGKM